MPVTGSARRDNPPTRPCPDQNPVDRKAAVVPNRLGVLVTSRKPMLPEGLAPDSSPLDPDELRATVTRLLDEVRGGDAEALESLAPLIYGQLKRLAANRLRGERADHSLEPTALVNEAWSALVGQLDRPLPDRGAFFRVASRTLRNVLVDHARRHQAEKRGGPHRARITTDPDQTPAGAANLPPTDIIALHEALLELEALSPRRVEVVELRFLAGLSVEETGVALDLSPATVKRDWEFARAWLFRKLRDD